ncbi:MAG TPA: hypothetical protein VLX61_15110 [Anaerolineales bacterium]|nr:hypothetical protein [Anaerolineales bacterium]
MKNTWIAVVLVALAAFVLELFGWWWAMPIAGLIGGWLLRNGKQGFVFGGLGAMAAWLAFVVFFAFTSPMGKLLVVVSGVLGLDASLAFVPALLAILVAFLLGGLGGLTGALFAQSV